MCVYLYVCKYVCVALRVHPCSVRAVITAGQYFNISIYQQCQTIYHLILIINIHVPYSNLPYSNLYAIAAARGLTDIYAQFLRALCTQGRVHISVIPQSRMCYNVYVPLSTCPDCEMLKVFQVGMTTGISQLLRYCQAQN